MKKLPYDKTSQYSILEYAKKLAGKFFDKFVKIVAGTTKIEEEIK